MAIEGRLALLAQSWDNDSVVSGKLVEGDGHAASQVYKQASRLKAEKADGGRWENKASGHSGYVVVLDVFQAKGRTCHEVEKGIAFRPSEKMHVVRATQCANLESGKWEPYPTLSSSSR